VTKGRVDSDRRHRILLAMVRTIAQTDRITGSHCIWVGRLAARIGRRMGMSERHARQLHLAGILHDLGKLGIPQSILMKPGPLTEQERDVVDRHAQIGAELAARCRANRRIQQAIRYHHDWYDGSKGTSGLRGTRLPQDARILAVADSFQSMVEERPYRRRLPHTRAVAELRRCSGSQFDPGIVETLALVVASRTTHPKGRSIRQVIGRRGGRQNRTST